MFLACYCIGIYFLCEEGLAVNDNLVNGELHKRAKFFFRTILHEFDLIDFELDAHILIWY